MEQASGKLTVFFDPPFWVGVFERIENGKLTVSKVTFGAEPKDYEVYDFILHHYYELKFSPPISTDVKQVADNPKRRQRNARNTRVINSIFEYDNCRSKLWTNDSLRGIANDS